MCPLISPQLLVQSVSPEHPKGTKDKVTAGVEPRLEPRVEPTFL